MTGQPLVTGRGLQHICHKDDPTFQREPLTFLEPSPGIGGGENISYAVGSAQTQEDPAGNQGRDPQTRPETSVRYKYTQYTTIHNIVNTGCPQKVFIGY